MKWWYGLYISDDNVCNNICTMYDEKSWSEFALDSLELSRLF